MTEMTRLKSALRTAPIVPVLTIPEGADAARLANGFARAGLKVAEVTLRTPAGLAAVKAMKAAQPDMLIGAGTVLNAADMEAALDAGADFLVSPGLSPDLKDAVFNAGASMIPGVATPTEAMTRNEEGFEFLKLFPASIVGGIDMLKAMAGPLAHLSFMPTGGVSEDNLYSYLCLSNVIAVGGTWLARKRDIESGNWAQIEERSRKALAIAKKPPDLKDAVFNAGASMIPGVATPTEAMTRNEEGFEFLKLFPASIVGGIDMLKAMAGPLAHLSFMPTGGVSEDNLYSYLCLSNVIAVGGTWLARKRDIESGNWAQIEERSRKALAIAKKQF